MPYSLPRRPSFPLALAFLATVCAPAASAAVTWNKVYSGFSSPVEITQARDGSQRIFVVQQSGKVRIIRGGSVLATPFIDLGQTGLDVTTGGGERGLLGIAFHPQYATNRQFYVNYTRKSDGATVIARYLASAGNADVADPASGAILLTIAQPEANHNGGAIKFGPDGYLYIGMGDGGGGNDQHGTIGNGQDKTTLLGKILRIDVDNGGANPYAIPPGNPYASGVGGLKEIFAIGLRNPWRMSFDRATGDFWFGDVGQGAVEEVDMLPAGTGAGTNFGWRIMEGTSCTGLAGPPNLLCNDPSLTLPVVQYMHALGCSVTGGYVYRGTAVPALVGQYLYGDYCTGRIWAAQRVGAGPWTAAQLGATGYAISTFGEDEAGELYFANYATGDIYQFADSAANTPVLVTPAGPLAFGNVTLGSSSVAQVFNITNGGGGTLSVNSLTSGGSNPTEFPRTGTCASGSMLTASQSCTVSYLFTPAQLGGRSADLTIATNAGNRTINLTGTGVAVPAPVLAVSASALAFGSVNVGSSSAAQTFTISNAGTGTLTLTALTAGGANSGDFLRTGTCANGVNLTAAQSCLVAYAFVPTAAGARTSSLAIVSSAGSATVTLDGTGVTPPAPGIGIAPTALDYAAILIGTTSPKQTVAVSNTGAVAVTLASIALQGSNPGDFVLANTCAPGSALGAGATCTVDVSFHPLVAGARSASLVVSYGAGMSARVDLAGIGTTPASDVVAVIEYYHAGLDHYFMASLPVEIAALDSGQFGGWARTHETFKAWSTRHIETRPVCRYYMPPIVGDSHFFSASPTECAVAPVLFPSFVLESLEVMHEVLPDEVSGACPPNTTPIYRVWNKRPDSNHRYLTNRAMRDAMVARGYVAEGYGPDAVVMCGP